jgi:hypothetical protein
VLNYAAKGLINILKNILKNILSHFSGSIYSDAECRERPGGLILEWNFCYQDINIMLRCLLIDGRPAS